MIIPLLVLWLTTAGQADKALELFGQGQAALAAIHFYSGLAYVQQPDAQMKAKEQIELFLVQMPKSTSVDKGQYPPEFVATT